MDRSGDRGGALGDDDGDDHDRGRTVLSALGEVLPAAVGVALSPIPIIAIVLVLATPRAATNGTAFAAGWVGGLAVTTSLMTVVLGGATQGEEPPAALAWVRIALGVALLAYAARTWITRPPSDAPAPMPSWMTSLEDLSTRRALVLGLALSGLNPKNLAFTLSAVTSIAALDLSGSDAVGAAALYVALASASVLGAVLAHAMAPERSAQALGRAQRFMVAHSTALLVAVLLLLGVMILGDGLAGL